jgi:hypothetical protein
MTIFSKFMASFDKREEKNYEILDFSSSRYIC